MRLSVAMVCKDNEATIGRSLESVAGLADEVVAVDSGSTDGTIGLLERAGARVIRSAWMGYVRTKQLALDACSGGWVLCLDSDESLEPGLAASVARAISAGGGPAGYEVNRRVWYRGRPLRHAWQPEWRLRLVRRGSAAWAGLDPHDRLELAGGARPGRLEGCLRHDSISTFAEFLAKQVDHGRTMARSMAAEGRRGSRARVALSPAGAFLKQIALRRAFLDGTAGFMAAASAAVASYAKHVALLELTRTPDGEPAGGVDGSG